VSRDQAEFLLSHPDIWFDARKPKVAERDPIKPRFMNTAFVKDEPYEDDSVFVRDPPLQSMATKPVLSQFAMAKFGVELPDSMSVDQMRAEVHRLAQGRRYA
jgi:hypothetical protein